MLGSRGYLGAIQLLPFAAAVARIPNLRIMNPASGFHARPRVSICAGQVPACPHRGRNTCPPRTRPRLCGMVTRLADTHQAQSPLGRHQVQVNQVRHQAPQNVRYQTYRAGMNDPPIRRYDVTVTVMNDDSPVPSPAGFAIAAEQAAAARGSSGVVSAHTADQIISVVTVVAASRAAAAAIALAVVSDALSPPSGAGRRTRPVAAWDVPEPADLLA